MQPSARRRRATTALVTAAQLGQAQWFFGNLYEAVAHIPDRLAADIDLTTSGDPPSLSRLLRPGSPVRYWLPVAPIALTTSVAALITGWEHPADRKWLGISTASTVAGAALTAYVVRQINLNLLFTTRPLADTERHELLRRWHRLNKLRLLMSGVAWLAGQRVVAAAHR